MVSRAGAPSTSPAAADTAHHCRPDRPRAAHLHVEFIGDQLLFKLRFHKVWEKQNLSMCQMPTVKTDRDLK